MPALDLAALDRALQALFDDWHHYVGSPAAIPFVRRILKQLLVSKLVFTIERGGASFTGALNLDPVLNLAAVKRISSDGPPEPAERLPVKDLPLDRFLWDGSDGPEGQHRGVISEGGKAPLRVTSRSGGGGSGRWSRG